MWFLMWGYPDHGSPRHRDQGKRAICHFYNQWEVSTPIQIGTAIAFLKVWNKKEFFLREAVKMKFTLMGGSWGHVPRPGLKGLLIVRSASFNSLSLNSSIKSALSVQSAGKISPADHANCAD